MNWCKPHWDELKATIKAKGLDDFGAQDAMAAVNSITMQLDTGEEPYFDPLMGSWSRINLAMAESMQKQGRGAELLYLKCPMCQLVEDGQPHLVQNWIQGVTDDARRYAIDQGLIQVH